MPSKSPAQAKLMRAVAHGWKPDRIKGPSRAVAQEFVEADKKYSGGFAENRYWTGGLAAMNEVNSGVPETLNWQEGGDVQSILEPIKLDMGNFKDIMSVGWYVDQGWTFNKDTSTVHPPSQTVTSGAEDPAVALAALTPQIRGENVEPWMPRVIPGTAGTAEPVQQNFAPSQIQSPEERAEQTALARQSKYRDQLREHKSRVAAALKPASAARGGHMNYQEGGAVPEAPQDIRPGLEGAMVGHAEGPNPYTKHIKTHPQMYNEWERRNHRDPAPIDGEIEPAIILPEEEEAGSAMDWLRDMLGVGGEDAAIETLKNRQAIEQERMEAEARGEYRGGHVRGYQVGGLAAAQGQETQQAGFSQPPTGGVPPRWSGAQRQQWRGAAGNQAARQNLRGAYGSWSPQQQTGYRGRVGWQQPPAAPPPKQWSGVQRNQWQGTAGDPTRRQNLRGAYQSWSPEEQAGYTGRVGHQQALPPPQAQAPPPAAAPPPPPAAAAAPPPQAPQWSGVQQQQWRNAAGNPAARQQMRQAYQSYSPEERAGYTGRVGFGMGGMARKMLAQQRARQQGAAQGRGAPPSRGGLAAMAQQQRQALSRRGAPSAPQGGGMASRIRQMLAQQGQRGRDSRPGMMRQPAVMPGGGQTVGGEITGGPRVPPNLRGMLQKMRMQNRPPPNVGGGVNRVGQQDQQGAQARAMQRGTGRRPMSRRGGFPGGGRRR